MQPVRVTSSQKLDLTSPDAEKQLKVLVEEALRHGDTRDLVTRIFILLLDVTHRGTTGLLVDCLELLDPTIISSCPVLQVKLVFGKTIRNLDGKEEMGNCRPYLLLLLTHQASYIVLRPTVASQPLIASRPSGCGHTRRGSRGLAGGGCGGAQHD